MRADGTPDWDRLTKCTTEIAEVLGAQVPPEQLRTLLEDTLLGPKQVWARAQDGRISRQDAGNLVLCYLQMWLEKNCGISMGVMCFNFDSAFDAAIESALFDA